MTNRLSAEQWSAFWQAGSITTFFQRFAQNYDSAILDFWKEVFEDQADQANIVDLATGNGAVAILASQFSAAFDKSFKVTGVDYAATDPKIMLKEQNLDSILGDINFVTDTRVEETGLDGGSFDLAMSQFGFEYADMPSAVAELDRILKPKGAVFAAMVHIQGSAIFNQAKEGVRQAKLCSKSGLIGPVADLLKRLDTLKKNNMDPLHDDECNLCRDKVNEITGRLHSAQSQFKEPGQIAWFLTNTMSLFNQKKIVDMDLEAKLDLLDQVEPEAELYQLRMKDLMSAAQSPEELASLERLLGKKGFNIRTSEEFDFEGIKFCHAIVVAR